MILGIIVACEIGFWLMLIAGLVARYVARMPRLSTVFLVLTPLVDVVLLVATAIDLRSGGQASLAHALAAIYIGFSIAYGHRMIAWADVRFAHRFAGGPAPVRLIGADYAKACWRDVPRTALAVGIAAAVLWLLTRIAAPSAEVEALTQTYRILAIILGADVLWAVGYTIWPRTK